MTKKQEYKLIVKDINTGKVIEEKTTGLMHDAYIEACSIYKDLKLIYGEGYKIDLKEV